MTFITAEAACDICNHEWVAVFPAKSTERIECPACGYGVDVSYLNAAINAGWDGEDPNETQGVCA